MRSKTLLLTAAITIGVCATPALAQRGTLTINGRNLSLAAAEMNALTALRTALSGGQRGQQDAALQKARSIVTSADGKYVLALYTLEIAQQRQDNAMRAEALDVLIASGNTLPDKLPAYLSIRGSIAYQAGDVALAKTLWTRLLTLTPNDPQAQANMALILQKEGDTKGASELLERVVAARIAAGQPVTEVMYRQWMSAAYQAKLLPAAIAAARGLVRAYPSPANWRDALVVYRQLAQPTGGMEIDLFRLMRAVGALTKAPEYQRMAQLLIKAGFPTEGKAVLTEGMAHSLLDPFEEVTRATLTEADRTLADERARIAQLQRPGAPAVLDLPDSLVGAGRHADAIPLYRALAAKGGPAAAEANVHLGMALVLAGQRAEAITVFTAVAAQPGGYAEIARFWLDWLAQQPAA